MDHSYEEIRAAALDVLSGREKTPLDDIHQYQNLSIAVAEAFARREMPEQATRGSRSLFHLSRADSELFMEVFWDLFRQNIITLGYNDSNREFPHFRLARFGKQILDNQDTYFFHDADSYAKRITADVPAIDPVTLLYLQEALQAFRAGCILSASVMLGVATEHTFDLLVEESARSPKYGTAYAAVTKERTVLARLNKYRKLLEQYQGTLPPAIKEDLDTHFSGILSIIRAVRNQSGHPTGKVVDREQVYVLLNLFIPYCRKMYQLMEHMRT